LIAGYRAEVKLAGTVWDEANAEATRLANEEEGALYIHPFSNADVSSNSSILIRV
jgi:threonine dehydratase